LTRGPSAVLLSLLIISMRINCISELRKLTNSIMDIQQLTFDNAEQSLSLGYKDFCNYELIVVKFYEKSGLADLDNFSALLEGVNECNLQC
jgi:hypothetical protein